MRNVEINCMLSSHALFVCWKVCVRTGCFCRQNLQIFAQIMDIALMIDVYDMFCFLFRMSGMDEECHAEFVSADREAAEFCADHGRCCDVDFFFLL